MGKKSSSVLTVRLAVSPGEAERPLYAQIRDKIRMAIIDGSFFPRSRLPSARMLARDLGLSRNTIEAALDALANEGFIRRKHGSGTYVADPLPEYALPPATPPLKALEVPDPGISPRGKQLIMLGSHRTPVVAVPFVPSLPTLELFPRRAWGQLLQKSTSAPGVEQLAYGSSAGIPELRCAIAAHVAATRAVRCSPDQVIVTTSCQQSIQLACQLLANAGDKAWMEEPGYLPAREALRVAGLEPVAIPVDSEGLQVFEGQTRCPTARLIYITPSHQYPTGAELSASRRSELVEFARSRGAWILEDDYDGDLRYEGRPIAALQAFDPDCILYMGSFSKTLFPALRIAYVIVPQRLISAFSAAKHLADGHTSTPAQFALATFINDGHLAAHIRLTREVYDERRRAFLKCAESISELVEIGPAKAGLHLLARFKRSVDDLAVAQSCARRGVYVDPLSRHCCESDQNGLVLGFAACSPGAIGGPMAVIRAAIETACARKAA